MTDHGLTAQNRSTGVNRNVVLDGGVALFAAQVLPATGRQRADGDALVNLHIVADDGGLAHYDAGAVVNKEVPANRGAGMDVDAGLAVCVFRHDAGQHGHP